MDTPLCCTKVYMLLLCFGSRKHPPPPYMSGTFVLAPPPPRTSKKFRTRNLTSFGSRYDHLFHLVDRLDGESTDTCLRDPGR